MAHTACTATIGNVKQILGRKSVVKSTDIVRVGALIWKGNLEVYSERVCTWFFWLRIGTWGCFHKRQKFCGHINEELFPTKLVKYCALNYSINTAEFWAKLLKSAPPLHRCLVPHTNQYCCFIWFLWETCYLSTDSVCIKCARYRLTSFVPSPVP